MTASRPFLAAYRAECEHWRVIRQCQPPADRALAWANVSAGLAARAGRNRLLPAKGVG